MRNIRFYLIILFVGGLQTMQGQTLSEDLSKAMEQQASGQYKEGTAKFKTYYESNAQAFLEALKPYAADTSGVKRLLACSLCGAAAKAAKEGNVRGKAIDILVGFVSDNVASVRATSIRALQGFRYSEYTDVHKQRLTDALAGKTYTEIKPAIRLAGFLNLQGLKEQLQGFTNDMSLKTRQRWEAHLALARMGDKGAIDYIMEKIKTVPVGNDLMYDFVPDLIYTHQKEVYDYIIEILESDKELCTSSNPDASGNILCGYRAMEYLAPVVENYPLKTRASGDIDTKDYKEALKTVRKWFKKHKGDYIIRKDLF